MKYVALIFISFLVPLFLGYIRFSNNKNKNTGIIRYAKGVMYLSIGGFVFILIVICLCWWQNQTDKPPIRVVYFLGITFTCYILMALYLFLISINFKLELRDDGFVYKNMFGKTRIYEYTQITKLIIYYSPKTKMMEKYNIVIDKRKIEVNFMMMSFEQSLILLKRKMKKKKCLHTIKIEEKVSKI